MRYLMWLFVVLAAWGGPAAAAQKARVPRLRLVWAWSNPKEEMEAKMRQVKEMGFNAVAVVYPGQEKAAVAACRKLGLACYAPIYGSVRNPKDPGQVMLPGEQKALAEQTASAELKAKYQFGGEPLYPEEIYWNPLLCPNRPETFPLVTAQIDQAIADGFDGIAFDYFGYQNYRGCHCPECNRLSQEFLGKNKALGEEKASAQFAEDSLVYLMNRAADYARAKKPGIKTTAHIYPYFRPNPFYGNRLKLDTCGVTASWFFLPHWDDSRIAANARKIVSEGSKYHRGALGAPFLGVYTRPPLARHKKDAARLRRELAILARSGAQAMQMAEFGSIMADEETRRVVSDFLHGMP